MFRRRRKRAPGPVPVLARRPRIALLYQDLRTEEAAATSCVTELADDLARYGWQVEALPARRGAGPVARGLRGLVYYRPVKLPDWPESGPWRWLLSAWMILAWSGLALRPAASRPDIVLIVSEPACVLSAARVIRRLSKRIRIAHWSLSPHPGTGGHLPDAPAGGVFSRLEEDVLRRSVQACDLIAVTGPAGARQLAGHGFQGRGIRVMLWPAQAPAPRPAPCPQTRQFLFGPAKIGLLFTYRPGAPDDLALCAALAGRLPDPYGVRICVAFEESDGPGVRALLAGTSASLCLVPVRDRRELEAYRAASDICVLSAQAAPGGPGADGDLAASLAFGRPVLCAGGSGGETGEWIVEQQTGWVLAEDSLAAMAAMLSGFASRPDGLALMGERCWRVYRDSLRQTGATERWHQELSALAGQDWFGRPRFSERTEHLNYLHPHLTRTSGSAS